MTPQNRCPDRYRNLTPAQECRLRGARLGTVERPGALPHMPHIGVGKYSDEKLRAMIIEACPAGRAHLMSIAGDTMRVHNMLQKLVEDGALTARRESRRLLYRVTGKAKAAE
jgi:hypothetical protein